MDGRWCGERVRTCDGKLLSAALRVRVEGREEVEVGEEDLKLGQSGLRLVGASGGAVADCAAQSVQQLLRVFGVDRGRHVDGAPPRMAVLSSVAGQRDLRRQHHSRRQSRQPTPLVVRLAAAGHRRRLRMSDDDDDSERGEVWRGEEKITAADEICTAVASTAAKVELPRTCGKRVKAGAHFWDSAHLAHARLSSSAATPSPVRCTRHDRRLLPRSHHIPVVLCQHDGRGRERHGDNDDDGHE